MFQCSMYCRSARGYIPKTFQSGLSAVLAYFDSPIDDVIGSAISDLSVTRAIAVICLAIRSVNATILSPDNARSLDVDPSVYEILPLICS